MAFALSSTNSDAFTGKALGPRQRRAFHPPVNPVTVCLYWGLGVSALVSVGIISPVGLDTLVPLPPSQHGHRKRADARQGGCGAR